ncbi:MAG: nitrile hydratase accessory protein [Dongiaceae bacterium]
MPESCKLEDVMLIPRDAEGPVFSAPWQARIFGAVAALLDKGVIGRDEFRDYLAAAVKAGHSHGDPATAYYEQWLAAAERLLGDRGLLASGAVGRLARDLAHQASHGHGEAPDRRA